jgi:hypothetical protein
MKEKQIKGKNKKNKKMDQTEHDISTWCETTNDNGDKTNAKYPVLQFYKYAWNLTKSPISAHRANRLCWSLQEGTLTAVNMFN